MKAIKRGIRIKQLSKRKSLKAKSDKKRKGVKQAY
jgi:hypothetical protein